MVKYRYLFVIRSLTGGGAERVVSILASGLAKRGYEVHLVIYGSSNSDYELNSKVILHVLGKNNCQNMIKQKLSRVYYIREIINEIQPDIIIPFLGGIVDATFLASRFKKCRFISTIRNNPEVQPANKIYRYWRNYINFRSNAVFVQNKIQKEYYFKFMHKKIFVLPNPISKFFFDNKKSGNNQIKNIVSVGRLTEQKNHLMLFKAFSEVIKKYPYLKLRIYGEGKLKEFLEQKINEMSLTGNVFLCGRVNNIFPELQKADLFVMSSDYEGMPNALMEAIAMGIPCISTDCPTGPADLIIDKETGYLVPVGEYGLLSNAIMDAVKNPKYANEMAIKARENLKNKFSEEKIVEKFIRLIEKQFK